MTDAITITHAQIEAIMASPGTLETIKTKLPTKAAYWLARAIVEMQKIYKVYKDQQQQIITAHAMVDDHGKPSAKPNGQVIWKPEDEETAGQKLKELAETEVDLHVRPIVIDPMPESMTIESMILLMPLLKEIGDA